MAKVRHHSNQKPPTEARIDKLLSGQTATILDAMDDRFGAVNKRLSKLEQQYDQLLRTLNKFLKRMTDMEEEFEFMKADLSRVKAILREKLGVVLD
jgi:hypothetical protein